ncbi:ankyrin repeat-containing domain protein [Xylariaceae sp. FL1651]|nr:ankyrin repeat-containing domain protein [Xylariaceae sp. FL1651]
MDPLSVTAGVVGLLDVVSRLSFSILRFKGDYKLADEDLNSARDHALLLKEEISKLEQIKSSSFSPPRKTAKLHNDLDQISNHSHLAIDDASFEKAIATARNLFRNIEASFPLRSDPHTWRSKVRWAMKDKQAFAHLKDHLQSAESTLQGIVLMEQLRVSRMIYGMLHRQQSLMEKLERGDIVSQTNTINMSVITRPTAQLSTAIIEAQLRELHLESKPNIRQHGAVKTKKVLPRGTQFDRWGFSGRLVAVPRENGTSYQAGMRISLLGKMYSVQLRMTNPGFSFVPTLSVRNIVPTDSELASVCRAGNFDRARQLLTNSMAHGNDVTAAGWPMLDYAIESGSARLVRLLLDHGADPNLTYGEHHMTALQSSFLRGELDIARILLNQGADIEHIDSDGYSVLSYLWIVDKPLHKSVEFMQLCASDGFSGVNACDSRGWTPFHRAAAVGTAEDVKAFLRLGASLDLRAEWYGWTALFFAASHDNVDTFQAIVEHSGPDILESLDGDGWTLLHCCTYFGAPQVLKIILGSGIDVNKKTHPAPLPEDPELSYRELTALDIAMYIGPNRYQMFMNILSETGRDADLTSCDEVFWDALDEDCNKSDTKAPIYGAEDVDDKWTLLHWASYNGSLKVKRLFMLKGADPEHLDAIQLEDNPTVLPTSPFDRR